ncbi:hypothetical protein HZB96_01485 [Candidatus Gottesmanbacteria bacterium]|nr:hypothetical protein [Candidatus Gottesmanbacteria bacterium]
MTDNTHQAENEIHEGEIIPPSEIKGNPLSLSPYTKALIKGWEEGVPKPSISSTKISVSQTVSFLAFLYEKMRNAIDFKEEHLIRRASIERIIKRRMLLNENGRDISELLIKELLWARYYENNTIGEEKIGQIQAIIDKYFFIRNEIGAGRSSREQERIASFIIEVMSCEIEENLSPNPRREAFINFAYQLIRPHLAPFDDDVLTRDIQVYIAVERTFSHSDDSLIRYELLKLMLPEITQISWKTADKILPKLYDVYQDIEKNLYHPLSDKIRNYVKKQIPPYLILLDVFNQNPQTIESILADEEKLKNKVDQSCRKRYEETKDRLRRTGIRSFIYIILTKVVFAFILEIPYDLYVVKSISYMPIVINVIFPPALMAAILLTVSVPGDENTRKIFNLIKSIVSINPEDPQLSKNAFVAGKKIKTKSPLFTAMFSALYLFTYLLSFGSIIYILTQLKFNPVSQGIFIFFVTLVTFFAFKVISITQEYLVVDKEGPLTPILDLFFLPVMRVGQWLSGEVLTKFNFLIFIFDFIIEMPLKAIVEVVDEWVHFVRLKKEEIV